MVCGDGEYIIYTSQALRNKAFGAALDFVWSAVGTGDYAVRESISRYVRALFCVKSLMPTCALSVCAGPQD